MSTPTASSAGRRRPSDRARYIAAEIRVEADRKLGDKTPDWIRELAEEGKRRFG
ncbi:hypothetical protein QWJ90_11950 [Microbacterium oryzae]|uniref:hypothetical protein n=1 Tax=Microbacterium oryzae TaxID=743009 RepID=UPI0025B240E0|nr:hypothetical protein [Microbacterium oryzae]MDN3311644.1 hypothetical protein [Microbacterium oryzae]